MTKSTSAASSRSQGLTESDVERQYKKGIHVGSGLPRATCPCGFCVKHRFGLNNGDRVEVASRSAIHPGALWTYCPECGSDDGHTEDTLKQCANCGQKWNTKINHTDTVRRNLKKQNDAARLLKEPNSVHLNMCRGLIAPITFDMLSHIVGDESTSAWIAKRLKSATQGKSMSVDAFIADLEAQGLKGMDEARQWVNEGASK